MPQAEPIRILLVDDEPSARTLLRRWIDRNMNAVIFEADDGLQALESIAENNVDLVVSDVSMPVMDGIELLRLLRTDPCWERLEVLMVSHVAAEDKVSQIIALGASDYLLKPLQYYGAVGRLMAAAERILRRRAAQHADAPGAKPKVLIADPDAGFRASAERALEAGFAVKTARSQAETLLHLRRWKPVAVFLSPAVPGLDIAALIAPATPSDGRDKPNFYRLDEIGARLDPPVPGSPFAAAVRKSYVAASFASQVGELVLGVPGNSPGLKPWADFLERELRTALFQTLGMMTGTEPEPDADARTGRAPGIYGRLGIRADNEMFKLIAGVDVTQALASQLAEAMSGGQTGQTLAVDALKEVLNAVAGRLRTACAERRVDVSMELPEAHLEAPAAEGVAAYRIDSGYRWKGESFRIFLEVYDLTPEPAGESAELRPVAAS